MSDVTRTGTTGDEGAAAFSAFVQDWLEDFRAVIECLVTLRLLGDAPEACSALLVVPDVHRLRESWELWESYARIDQAEADRRLARHLTQDRVSWLRFGLWGTVTTAER